MNYSYTTTPMAIERLLQQVEMRIKEVEVDKDINIVRMIGEYHATLNSSWILKIIKIWSAETYAKIIFDKVDLYTEILHHKKNPNPNMDNFMMNDYMLMFYKYYAPIQSLKELRLRAISIMENASFGVKAEYSEVILLSQDEFQLIQGKTR